MMEGKENRKEKNKIRMKDEKNESWWRIKRIKEDEELKMKVDEELKE